MDLRARGGVLLLVLGALAPSSAPAAQSGPGVPHRIYDGAELFTEITRIGKPGGGTSSHGHSMMHDGYLAVVRYSPGAVEFYGIENPYEPRLVHSLTGGAIGDLSEPHTYARTTAYGGQHVVLLRGPGGLGGTGFGIWDWSDVTDPVSIRNYDLPGVPGGYATGTFWLFYQAPYVFCGAGSLGLFVVDASDPANPFVVAQLPTSQTGGFNAVNTLAVGNLLVVTNSDGGPGMARFDISDPENPQLVSATLTTSIPYGLQLSGGRLFVPAVSGPVAGGGNGGVLEMRDPFQAGFPVMQDLTLPSRGGSVVLQDGFAHVAASTTYEKVDVSSTSAFSVTGSTPNTFSGGDWDWVTPVGNLAVLGDDQSGGTSLVPHDMHPDNTGPAVSMVVPADGATGQALTTRVGITLTDMVELTSLDASTFAVRPVGGAALSGSYSCQFGIVNFTPDAPLAADTTYEVLVPAGGLRDWSGNPTVSAFSSRFSTGSSVSALVVTPTPGAPAVPGQSVPFDVESVVGTGPFQYSWSFGDGTPATPLAPTSPTSHVYADAGHFPVVVTVTNGAITSTASFVQTIHHPLTADRPTHSSTIVVDDARARVWCVNPDNDTVTSIHATQHGKELEVPVGAHPRTLALAPDGTLWVVCQDASEVRVLDATNGEALDTIPLAPGAAPYGLAFAPDGSAGYVTLRDTGQVARLDPTSRSVSAVVDVGPDPRGVAVSADSARVFVTRFRSSGQPSPLSATVPAPQRAGALAGPAGSPTHVRGEPLRPVGEVYELSSAPFALARRLPLAVDEGPDTESSGRGLPNYLGSPAVSPDGRRLWIPSKKDNLERGGWRDGQPLTFQSTVRTIASQVDLAADAEVLGARIDFNDRDMAAAVALSPLGDYAFFALQGSNALDVRDAYTGAIVAGFEGVGLAPQGLALSADGRTLFVHGFLSRSISVLDVSGVTSSTVFDLPLLASVPTVASEALAPEVLAGKRIFYDASDPRMNEDGYLSCASCHLDGEHDGQVWDFTDRGEGLRNTISLLGKGGTGQGNVHWTANFDEIQDFENDMRQAFGGDGFLTNAQFFGPAERPLGAPKAGLSAELDALAAYVSSLASFGTSPHRAPNGELTASAQAGKATFQSLGCATCHAGPGFTDSPSGAKHDVGTLRASSGQASGEPLTGLDTPTLRGLWSTGPYLHDGSAATLLDVLTTRNANDQHGVTSPLGAAQLGELVDYLLQIDDREPEPPPSAVTARAPGGSRG